MTNTYFSYWHVYVYLYIYVGFVFCLFVLSIIFYFPLELINFIVQNKIFKW